MTGGVVRCGGLIRLDPAESVRFSDTNRFVQRFARYSECEVLVVGWNPGQTSSYHDHGSAQSVVVLVEGVLTARTGDESMTIRAGGVLITPVGVKHQIENRGPDRAVTVHIYAPPSHGRVSDPFLDHTAW